MQAKPKQIAVVIPCYNEAESIVKVIQKFARAKLTYSHCQIHFYVVDNNSTDETAQLARQNGAHVVHEARKGKGFALRTGFRAVASDIDYVVMLDGDDTYSPEEICRMVEPLESDFCDVVVGSRLGGHIQTKAMSGFNRFGNWFFTNAVRILYRANVTDVLSGYFAWKKPALDALYPHLHSPGFAIEMEMITKMARLKQRLTSVPISYHPRAGESNLHPIRDGLRILKMFIKNIAWRPRTVQQIGTKPQKIVFVSDSVYPYMKGGKEKRLYEISQRLATTGYDVHIYTMHWWSEAASMRQQKGVTLHALCKLRPLYRGNRRSIRQALVFALSCLKLYRISFDVLDVDHMPFFPILSSWLVCKLRRRRFYGTWHEALSRQEWMNYMGGSGRVASYIERISIRLPHTITAASAHTKMALETLHGRAERVALVASGIDAQYLATVQPADVQCDVLFVGRFVKDKRIDTLIHAVHIMRQKHSQVQCLLIGEGPERQQLKKLVAHLGLKQNVHFVGILPHAHDIYAHMKAAKVFCLPSVREGFSIVTLEALGCGTPVVTVDATTNAAKQLITPGQNGSVVGGTPHELAAAIEYWLSLPQKPDTSAHVAAYDWNLLAKQQAEVYSQ